MSGGSSGGGTNSTVTQQQSQPPAAFENAYQQLIGQVQNQGSQPLQQVPLGDNASNYVAPLNSTQNQAFQQISNLQGVAQPYINQAGQNFSAATTPVQTGTQQFNAQNIGQYMSPYTSSVIDATKAQLAETDAQQQQGVVGNAISAGAWGGDRSAVAQGILGGQQALANNSTIANLENTGYSNAVNQFNTQNQQTLSANQANASNALNAGVGQANLGNEALQTGLAGSSALLQAGGLQQQQQQAVLGAQNQYAQNQQAFPYQSLNWLDQQLEGLGAAAGGTSSGISTSTSNPSTLSTVAGLGTTGLGIAGLSGAFSGSGSSGGGLSSLFSSSPDAWGDVWKNGGRVGSYDDGGGIDSDDEDTLPAQQRSSSEDLSHAVLSGVGSWKKGGRIGRFDDGGATDDDTDWSTGGAGIAPVSYGDTPDYGQGIGAFPSASPATAAPSGPSGIAANGYKPPVVADRASDIRAQAPWLGLTAAGLGMLAGRSNGVANIGQGALEGLKVYSGQQQAANEAEKSQEQMTDTGNYRVAGLDQEARRLSDAADQARARIAQTDKAQAESERHNQAQETLQQQQQDLSTQSQAANIGIQQQQLVPQSIREARAYASMTPDQQAAYDKINSSNDTGWQLYTDKDGNQVRTNPNQGLVQQFNAGNGQWEAVDHIPEGLTKIGTVQGGAINQRFVNRVVGASNEGVAALASIAGMGDPSSGFFGQNRASGMFGAGATNYIAGTLTPERIKRYNATIAGLAPEIATAQNQGMAPNEEQIQSIQRAISIDPTDDAQTKQYRVALGARYLDKALEVSQTTASPDQKKLISTIRSKLGQFPDPDVINAAEGPGMFPGRSNVGKPVEGAPQQPQAQQTTPSIPKSLSGIQGLQWSQKRQQYKDPSTGKVYDADGNPVGGP
jgi:hypothetical protein